MLEPNDFYVTEFFCDECDMKVDDPIEVSIDHRKGRIHAHHCRDCGQEVYGLEQYDEPDECQVTF